MNVWRRRRAAAGPGRRRRDRRAAHRRATSSCSSTIPEGLGTAQTRTAPADRCVSRTCSFADPRVKLADMTGDGLQDIVLVDARPRRLLALSGLRPLGPARHHAQQPEFAGRQSLDGIGFDPQRVLLGDVDGDGLADLVYVDRGTSRSGSTRAATAGAIPSSSMAPRPSPTRRRAAGRHARHRHSGRSVDLRSERGHGQHLQVPGPDGRRSSPMCSTGWTTTWGA